MKRNRDDISEEVKNAGRERNTIGPTEGGRAEAGRAEGRQASHGDPKTESRSASQTDGRSGRGQGKGSDDHRSGSESGRR